MGDTWILALWSCRILSGRRAAQGRASISTGPHSAALLWLTAASFPQLAIVVEDGGGVGPEGGSSIGLCFCFVVSGTKHLRETT